ncbi:hypothetical protein [Streptomyces sp. NPDC050560]|uniref:hypothetical protein n=1 Tax=Streptomyces sp. NPDC050560 TaxID=3365630 RepID=UPI00379E9AA9
MPDRARDAAGDEDGGAPGAEGPGGLRVTAITSLTPLEELDADPFLVDTRNQLAMCRHWAAGRGHVITSVLVVNALRCDHRALWEDADAGRVDLFLAAGPRVLERALASVAVFAAECDRRGIALATADLPEPRYSPGAKAVVHRRLSMPTAGYDGT